MPNALCAYKPKLAEIKTIKIIYFVLDYLDKVFKNFSCNLSLMFYLFDTVSMFFLKRETQT
jgi:hypothetical protein